MKKIIVCTVSLLAIFCAIYSCQKTSAKVTTVVNQDLLKINQQFNTNRSLKIDGKYWCRVATGDLGGAWGGSWAGGKVGAWFGPQGAGIGAVVGGVIFGAVGSYGVSRCCGGVHVSPQNNGFNERVENFDHDFIIPNSSNVYDASVGKRHNEILSQMLLNANNNSNGIFSNVSLTPNEMTFYQGKTAEANNFKSSVMNDPSLENIKSNIHEMIDDPLILVTIDNFMNGYYNIQDIQVAYNYISAYENYITTSGNYNTEQTSTLLKGLSVARYSSRFWSEVL